MFFINNFLKKKIQLSYGNDEENFLLFVEKNFDEYIRIISPEITKKRYRIRLNGIPCPTLWELYKIQKYINFNKINEIKYGNMSDVIYKLFKLCEVDKNNLHRISLYVSNKNGEIKNYDYVLVMGENINFYVEDKRGINNISKKNEKKEIREIKIEENLIVQLNENFDYEFYTFSIYAVWKYLQ